MLRGIATRWNFSYNMKHNFGSRAMLVLYPGGGLNIHTLKFSPNVFSKSTLMPKKISRAGHEYMNLQPPPRPIKAPALLLMSFIR